MTPWTLSYNTNGFAHHRLDDAVKILSEIGYGAVALTLDVHHLDPFAKNHESACADFKALISDLDMKVTIESGARFNLNARRKHYPSLLCRKDGGDRLDFLARCHDTAERIGASNISFWSGHNFDDLPSDEAWGLLAERISVLTEQFKGSSVAWAVEPEPGMFIEDLNDYDRLCALIPNRNFGLALDLGHLAVTQERTCEDAIRSYSSDIVVMAIEDMKMGVHDHLPFGEGDMNFAPIFQAMLDVNYQGILAVELSRSSSTAPQTATNSFTFLTQFQ